MEEDEEDSDQDMEAEEEAEAEDENEEESDEEEADPRGWKQRVVDAWNAQHGSASDSSEDNQFEHMMGSGSPATRARRLELTGKHAHLASTSQSYRHLHSGDTHAHTEQHKNDLVATVSASVMQ